jgi:hypothetical protein
MERCDGKGGSEFVENGRMSDGLTIELGYRGSREFCRRDF